MKHILLSILMVLAIGLSIPSNIWAGKYLPLPEHTMNDEVDNNKKSVHQNLSFDSTYAIKPSFKPTVTKEQLYLKQYFKSLNINFGHNSKGTCTFIALGMMLSYYDSCINDNIIQEQYDVVSTGDGTDMISRNNSPGTLFDEISNNDAQTYFSKNVDALSKFEYYNVLKQKYPYSFQLKLIELANEKGFITLNESTQYLSIATLYMAQFAKEYLNSVGFVEGTDYVVNFTSGNKVKQFILDNVDAGRPVYVSGCKVDYSSSHAFICYDYDDIDNIYSHYGWHYYGYSRINPFYEYPYGLEAISIEFKQNHTHSYNYMVGTKAYCYCNDAINAYHYHSYETVLNYDKTYHATYCACGKYTLNNHWVRGATTGRYANCATCGALIDLYDGPIIGTLSLFKTVNGSYIHPSGIPVIMEADVEAYLNGTLKFGGLSDFDYI